jgi:hypothetical protein
MLTRCLAFYYVDFVSACRPGLIHETTTMNIFHTAPFKRWFLPALVAACMMPAAYADTAQQPSTAAVISEATESVSPAENAGPRFSVLEDRLYQLSDSLTGAQASHYYGFVAQRGQDVLLNVFKGDAPTSSWKVEYYENGDWVAQTLSTKVFSNLAPGAEIIIRVTPRTPNNAYPVNYALAFGSYPVLQKYDLHDEPGVIRIPVGHTVPDWLATQIYKEALLEVKFTDTKGAPLAGALAVFLLRFNEDDLTIGRNLISGPDGAASQLIDIGRCDGGYEALEFEHVQRGFNTWKTHYKVGGYYVMNALSGDDKLRQFYLGHICSQKVQKTIPFRN